MLTISNLSFSFRNHSVFHDLNMQFEPGKVTGIVGNNGVGKTTLFRTIAGIYKPLGGKMQWQGTPLKKKDIAFLPTDPFSIHT